MAEEARSGGEWEGSPLQMGSGLDPYGIQEIVVEFGSGSQEVLRPKMREEFGAYELHQTATYIDSLAHKLRH